MNPITLTVQLAITIEKYHHAPQPSQLCRKRGRTILIKGIYQQLLIKGRLEAFSQTCTTPHSRAKWRKKGQTFFTSEEFNDKPWIQDLIGMNPSTAPRDHAKSVVKRRRYTSRRFQLKGGQNAHLKGGGSPLPPDSLLWHSFAPQHGP